MSAEHITNQTHLKETDNRILQMEALKLRNELTKNKNPDTIVQKIDPKTDYEPNSIQQLLTQQSEITKQAITKRSYEQMQSTNQLINAGLEEQVEQEIDLFFNPKPTHSKDEVTLSKQTHQRMDDTPKQLNRNEGANAKASQANSKGKKDKLTNQTNYWIEESEDDNQHQDRSMIRSKETKKTEVNQNLNQQTQLGNRDLKEFATLISKYTLQQDPNAKHIIDKKRNELLKQGFTTSELNFATAKVGLLFKHHFIYDLKQKLINYHMSKGFSKQTIAEHSLDYHSSKNMMHNLRQSGQLTADISGVLDQLKHQARQDLGNFLFDESVNQFTKQSLGQISLQEFTEELIKLQKAAQSAGVVISEKELTDKICSAIDHLGLSEFTPPDPNSQQKKEPEKYISPEEVLDDKLRYLYMMKALHPSLRQKIDVHFKMKKCKNGMIKLGIYTEEKEDLLKKQGEFLAAKQFTEELQFLYREEATLPFLTGSEYGVIRKKKAFFISQLRKIEHGPTQHDLDKIKESMYREMYALIKEEIMQLEELVEIHQHVSITKRLKHYKTVISRITDEVSINDHEDIFSKLKAPSIKSTINEGA